MARRSDARRRLELLAQAGLTPAHRLIDMVYLAHADQNQSVNMTQGIIQHLSGYGRRHVYEMTSDLVSRGFLVQIGSKGKTPIYRIEDGHPTAQQSPSFGTSPRCTKDDAFLLQIHHAEVFGYEAPSLPIEGAVLERVLTALQSFGPARCRAAHHGHKAQSDQWPEGARFATFSCCYPPVKGKNNRLEGQWFQDRVQQGSAIVKKQAQEAERDRKAREEDAQWGERVKLSKGAREHGKRRAREALAKLRGLSGSPATGDPSGQPGTSTGRSSGGSATSAEEGPVALGSVVTAGPLSGTNKGKERT